MDAGRYIHRQAHSLKRVRVLKKRRHITCQLQTTITLDTLLPNSSIVLARLDGVGPTGGGVTNRLLTISHIVCSPALPHGHIPRSLSRVSKWTNGHVTVHVPGIHGKGERFVFPGPNILPNTISTPNPRRRETRCWLATCGSCYLYLHLLSLQLLFYFGFLVHECVYSSV